MKYQRTRRRLLQQARDRPRLNHTETMRDMSPLDKPRSWSTVAGALQGHAPARTDEGAEMVAGGQSRRDAPARGGGAGAGGDGGAQEEERR